MTILNQPCPECFRHEDGKWFYPCPSDDCVLHGNREDRAFTHVEESNNNCSFLCNEDGLDIATLHRVRPDEVSNADHKAACLSDKGWQATVNLIAAAPAMLDALQSCEAALAALRKNNRWDVHPEDFNDDVDEAIDAQEQARAAIERATK